jgi:hypothetical protein
MKLQVKHIAYGAIFLLVSGLTFQSYRLSVKNTKLEQLDTTTLLLKEEIKHKSDSIDLLEARAIVLQSKSDSLNKVVNTLQKDKDRLYTKLDSALSAIDSIPAEDNYVFLRDSAYNYPGELEFPFNSKQVTEIRKDFTENGLLKKINVNLATTIDVLQKQNEIKDNLILNQNNQLDLYENMIDSYKDVVEVNEKSNAKLTKEVIKQKRVKYLFQGISVAGGIFILISIL